MSKQRIAILGGGISGLASAFRLAQAGHSVEVFESSDSLGGLGTFFEFDGKKIDRFYHCIMPSDDSLLGLIDDLGISDRLYWRNTLMGMVYERRHYPFNTPVDLLRFSALSISERLRLGAMSVALPHLGQDEKLDVTPIGDWLTKLFGKRLWRRFWEPLFRAKFGVAAKSLPSLYLSKRLGRESNVAKRGYLDGGLADMIKVLSEAIRDLGGRIHLATPVEEIANERERMIVKTSSDTSEFDTVISTIPVTILKKIASDVQGIGDLPTLTYQGVVNLLVFLNRPLDEYYWTPVLESSTGFDGVVESSALVKNEQYLGNHAAYLMKYTAQDSELFLSDEDTIKKTWLEQFLEIYAERGITRSNIEACFLFKAPFVEPLYPLGYSNLKPGIQPGPNNLFLATTAQVYPNITSWNSSIRVAEECVDQILKKSRLPGEQQIGATPASVSFGR